VSDSSSNMLRTVWNLKAPTLETAVLRMSQRSSGRNVTLIAVIHVGARDYYAEIQRLLDEGQAAGAAILYEGLGSLSESEVGDLPARERAIYRALAPLHELYSALAQSLDLVFQGDALRYDRARWVNADLTLRELLRRWADSGAPMLPLDAAGGAKLTLPRSGIGRGISAFALLQTPLMLSAINAVQGHIPAIGKLRELLVSDRNRAALDALESIDPHQDALILYGAGHMPGIRAGLELRGYRAGDSFWLRAFSMRLPWSGGVERLREQGGAARDFWRATKGR
jgi:hypothetical protein